MCACVAIGCTNRVSKKIPGITFHRFPVNESKKADWTEAVRRKDWTPTPFSRICSSHFSADMFDRSMSRVILKDHAIPTVFESFPSCLQQDQTECDAEKLLLCIENRPSIYNFRLKEHSNRDVIDKLWKEIAEEMNLSVAVCKTKWVSLWNSYNWVLREGRDCPSGSKSVKKHKWYLMDAMEFLRDFVGAHRKMGSNIEEEKTVEVKLGTVEEETALTLVNLGLTLRRDFIGAHRKKMGNHEAVLTFEDYDKPVEERPWPSSIPQPHVKKTTAADNVVAPMIEFLKSRTKRSDELEKENSTLTFFRNLLPDIDKLSEFRKRKFKEEVMIGLNRHLDEQENVNYSQPPPSTSGNVNYFQTIPSHSSPESSMSNTF